MSSNSEQAAQVEAGANVANTTPPSAVPPPGYPVNGETPSGQQVPSKSKKRGEGFWKGCAAALCCCFVFEACCD